LNPVRAGIVPPERLPEYRHSSLRRFLGRDRPAWLIADTVLIESGQGNLKATTKALPWMEHPLSLACIF
jgi:hypothetical protein